MDLATDPARREAMGRAGHAYVRENYDWNVIGRDFVRHINELAERSSGRTGAIPHDPPTTMGVHGCSTTQSPSSVSAT
jgi:hypothetical protein